MASLLSSPAATPAKSGCGSGPRTRRAVGTVGGFPTEIIHIAYSNRDFVVVTQMGKFGTLFSVDRFVNSRGETKLTIDAIFGQRGSEILQLIVRIVATSVSPGSPKPMTVSLAMKSPSMKDQDALVQLLAKLS